MGYDVGAYKTIKKEKRIFDTFKIAEMFDEQGKERTEFVVKLHEKMSDDEFGFIEDKYVLTFGYYDKAEEQTQEELDKWLNRSQQLLEIIKETDLLENNNRLALWMKEKIEQGYAIGKRYVDEYGFFCFKELEKTEKIDFIEDDYIDTRYPNGEIPRAFEKLEQSFGIELRKYLINDEDLHFNFDAEEVERKLDYDANEAIEVVKNIYDKIKDEYTRKVMDECLRLWTEGGKLVYNR